MRIVIMTTLVLWSTTVSAMMYRSGYGSAGYDFNTNVEVNHRTQQVEINNFRTGQFNTYDVERNRDGSYSGTGFDYKTRRMINIDVDNMGNVRVFEW